MWYRCSRAISDVHTSRIRAGLDGHSTASVGVLLAGMKDSAAGFPWARLGGWARLPLPIGLLPFVGPVVATSVRLRTSRAWACQNGRAFLGQPSFWAALVRSVSCVWPWMDRAERQGCISVEEPEAWEVGVFHAVGLSSWPHYQCFWPLPGRCGCSP